MGVAERRERERAERRNQIVDAAEQLFFELGPVAATMGDVAKAAELSKGTLYLYFRSKDDLYLAIALRGATALLERVAAIDPAGLSGFEQLEHTALAFRAYASEHPRHLRSMIAWLASGFHADPANPCYADYLAAVSKMVGTLVNIVERGKQDGSIRPDVDALQFVLQLWGGTMGQWMLYFSREQVSQRLPVPVDFDGLVASFSNMLLRAIRADTKESSS